jgi:2-C-methyl-D-erythritol 4-phosphate cytidylyltransferase
VVKDDDRAKFAENIAKHLPNTEIKIVIGGKTRMHSVFNGLSALTESAKFAAVHDAARPFTSDELLLNCLQAARNHNGAIVAKRITDTVKKSNKNHFIIDTLNRDELWTVETPQIFPTKTLICAYRKAFKDGITVTDDAGIMEHSGYSPFLYEHKSDNTKITFQEDLQHCQR